MRPEDNLWIVDIVFLVISLLMLLTIVLGVLAPQDPAHQYAGPGFVDASFGWISTVWGVAILLFLVTLLATSITRLLYRIQHRKRI